MLKFEQFLEDAPVAATAVAPVNSTSNIAQTSNPIGLLKRRVDLPQIHKENYPEFLNDLMLSNIKTKNMQAKRSEFTPTQKEFNYDKIGSIKKSIMNGEKLEPVLVSKDNFIIDGHHRWLAHRTNSDQAVTKVDLEYEDFMKFIDNKPYVVRKTIHEFFYTTDTENTLEETFTNKASLLNGQVAVIPNTIEHPVGDIVIGSLIKFKLPNPKVTVEFPDLDYAIYGTVVEINDVVYTIAVKISDQNNPFYSLIKIDITNINIAEVE